jgi:hypothetical protein
MSAPLALGGPHDRGDDLHGLPIPSRLQAGVGSPLSVAGPAQTLNQDSCHRTRSTTDARPALITRLAGDARGWVCPFLLQVLPEICAEAHTPRSRAGCALDLCRPDSRAYFAPVMRPTGCQRDRAQRYGDPCRRELPAVWRLARRRPKAAFAASRSRQMPCATTLRCNWGPASFAPGAAAMSGSRLSHAALRLKLDRRA